MKLLSSKHMLPFIKNEGWLRRWSLRPRVRATDPEVGTESTRTLFLGLEAQWSWPGWMHTFWGINDSFSFVISPSCNQNVYACFTFIFWMLITCFFSFTCPHGEELCSRTDYNETSSHLHWWFRWWYLELLNCSNIGKVLDLLML